jgi:hypothetical protein
MNAMLARAAEACMEGMEEARAQMSAAEDAVAFERATRAFTSLCRNVRQVVAMKQRFDREQVTLEAARRGEAEAQSRVARERWKRDAQLQRERVRQHFERAIWDAYEPDEAEDLFEDLDDRLDDLSRHADFLDTGPDDLIQRLTAEFGIGEARDACAERASPDAAAPAPAHAPAMAPGAPPEPAALAQPEPSEAPSSEADPPLQAAPPDAPPERPPERPPEPPPDPPYIPPWEKLRPGQWMPGGGTGW